MSMFQQNERVNVIKHLFECVDIRSWEVLSTIFHADIVYERPGYDPIQGLERLLYFYSHERVLAAGQHTLERIITAEDAGACWGWFTGSKKDGSAVHVGFADVYLFSDTNLIIKRRSYFYEPSV